MIPVVTASAVTAPVAIVILAPELQSYDSNAAYLRALPRISAVPEDTLLPFNRDVVNVVNVVLRALPVLLTHLPALHETYVAFDDVRLTGLTDAANALHHAHHTPESSLKGTDELAGIFPHCVELRENMIYDIDGLVSRGVVKKGLLGGRRRRVKARCVLRRSRRPRRPGSIRAATQAIPEPGVATPRADGPRHALITAALFPPFTPAAAAHVIQSRVSAFFRPAAPWTISQPPRVGRYPSP